MANVISYLSPQSRWNQQGTQLDITVGFIVENIDTTMAPAALMVAARAMLPPFGAYYDSSDADASRAQLLSVQFAGQTNDSVYGQMVYSTATGLQPSTLIVSVDTRTVQVSTNMGPDGTPIKARYQISLFQEVPTDFIEHSVRVPCTQVTVESINYSQPDNSREQYVGRVISDTYRGRSSGSWLVDGFTTVYSVYQGTTTSRIVLLGAPGAKKWWLTGILYNSRVGKFIYYDGLQTKIQTALGKPYAYGEQAEDGDGFSVFGWYDTVSLANLSLPASAL